MEKSKRIIFLLFVLVFTNGLMAQTVISEELNVEYYQIVKAKKGIDNTDIDKGELFGQVFAELNELEKGAVDLYKKDEITGETQLFSTQPIEIDTATSGILFHYFFFPELPYGEYYILAKIDSQSQFIGSYVNTYYPSTYSWQFADFFEINQATNSVSIYLNRFHNHQGIGTVTGQVVFETTLFPGNNLPVYLVDNSGNVSSIIYTDDFGNFCFSNIEVGYYKLKVEYMSKISEGVEVYISNANPTVGNIFLSIGLNTIYTSIKCTETISDKSISLYPNPAKDVLNITISIEETKEASYQIYSQEGKLVSTESFRIFGDQYFRILLDEYSSGLYIFILNIEGQEVRRKFIVQ